MKDIKHTLSLVGGTQPDTIIEEGEGLENSYSSDDCSNVGIVIAIDYFNSAKSQLEEMGISETNPAYFEYFRLFIHTAEHSCENQIDINSANFYPEG